MDAAAIERFKYQGRDDNPDVGQRDAARATLARLATPDVRSYPPVAQMARNAATALLAAARDGFRTVDAEERERRLGICSTCPEYNPAQGRCVKCGCALNLKSRLASSHCPMDPPRW